MIRVSIIGAGRNRSGIGEYTAKYFHKNKAQVVSVLGTTGETSGQAAVSLKAYGIESTPYTNFDAMVEEQRPDAVVIASPSRTHLDYLQKCAELGVHVFCEKPFIWPLGENGPEAVEGLLQRFQTTGVTVAMNSQLPFALNDYSKLCGRIDFKRRNTFFILLSPFCEGKEMIPESVPHALSLLYVLFGRGEIVDVTVDSAGSREMTLRFRYLVEEKECEVTIQLTYHKQQPRPFQFGVNGRTVNRHLDLSTYAIYFEYKGTRIRIADPLELSVINFMDALQKRVEPLIGPSHISATTSLLKGIYDELQGNEARELRWRG
jgi:hypothetical protein